MATYFDHHQAINYYKNINIYIQSCYGHAIEVSIFYIVIIITAIEFSLGGSSLYISTDKTNNIHKRNNKIHIKYKYTYYENIHTNTQTPFKKSKHIHTHTSQNSHMHTPTLYKIHICTHTHITKSTHTHTHTTQNPHVDTLILHTTE